MKKIITLTLLAGLSVSLAGCDNMTKQDVGVLTGGTLGALVGSQIGGGSGKSVAIVAGALVGGLVGGQVGKTMDDVDKMKVGRVLEKTPTNQTTSWRNPDNGTQYSVTPTKTYYDRAKQPCREYTTKAWIGGKQETIYGKACRQADGSWKVIN